MRRLSQIKLVLFFFFSLHVLAEAADKIRIAIPEPNAAYMTFPLAHEKRFFDEPGHRSRGFSDARHSHDAGAKQRRYRLPDRHFARRPRGDRRFAGQDRRLLSAEV